MVHARINTRNCGVSTHAAPLAIKEVFLYVSLHTFAVHLPQSSVNFVSRSCDFLCVYALSGELPRGV